MEELLLLGGAIALMTVGHLIRIYRWGLFIIVYEKPNLGRLLRATAAGYFANIIVPYKLGDILRAWVASINMKTGKALALSTVIVDRLLDIIIVGIIFTNLTISGNVEGKETSLFYILSALSLLLGTVILYILKTYVKKCIVSVARIFNDKIEGSLLRFSFALISNFKDIFRNNKIWRLIGSTVGMWFFYIASYYVFSKCASLQSNNFISWIDLFVILFSQSSVISSTGSISFLGSPNSINPVSLLLFMLAPIVLLWAISYFFREKKELQIESNNNFINLLPQSDLSERLLFLETYFSDKNREYVLSYLYLNQNITIIRDYSAGSNATTMLCTDGKKIFFRKYAFGAEGEKLFKQIEWITLYSNTL